MSMRRKLLCLPIFALLLQGCTNENTTASNTTKLNIALFDGAYDNAYWREIADRFETDHPGVSVVLNTNENIGNILLPRMSGNTLPDVVYLGSSNSSGFTQAMIKEEEITSLSDVFTPALKNRFMENVFANFAISPYEDEEVYLAPLYFNVTGLWYNNTLFQEYGYTIPTTWDEFFSLGDQAKADGIDLFIYQGLNPTYLEALLWPMLAEKIGPDNLDKIYQNSENAWSQEGVLEVLETFEKLRDYMKADTISLTYMEAQRRFVEGKALFIPCGNWLKTEMEAQVSVDDELLLMNSPSYQRDAKRYATIMIEQIYVPKRAKEVALGKAFVAYQFASDSVKLNQEMSGGVVPLNQEAQGFEEQPFQMFNEGVSPISANFSPLLEMDMYREVFEQLSKVLSGTSSAKEVIDYLNSFTHE